MIDPKQFPPGLNEREIRKWLKENDHPAVKASRYYIATEYAKRLSRACFVGGPAIAFLLLSVIALIEPETGQESLAQLMIFLYGIGLINSVAINLMNGWHSSIDEVVDNYLVDRAVSKALGNRHHDRPR